MKSSPVCVFSFRYIVCFFFFLCALKPFHLNLWLHNNSNVNLLSLANGKHGYPPGSRLETHHNKWHTLNCNSLPNFRQGHVVCVFWYISLNKLPNKQPPSRSVLLLLVSYCKWLVICNSYLVVIFFMLTYSINTMDLKSQNNIKSEKEKVTFFTVKTIKYV